MLFADLLSLHFVTFLMFFILVSIYCVSTLSLYRVYRLYDCCVLFSLLNKAIATDQLVVIKATEYLLLLIDGNAICENTYCHWSVVLWYCNCLLPLIGGTVIPQLSIATACWSVVLRWMIEWISQWFPWRISIPWYCGAAVIEVAI